MNCNESLTEYEIEMAELESAYSSDIVRCDKNLSSAQTTLQNIRANIAVLVDSCKDELINKYTNFAIEELQPYLEWFSISVDLQTYCGDEEYQSKVEKIKQLIILKEQTEELIDKIKLEKKKIEETHHRATEELTRDTEEIYTAYANTITTDLNLAGKTPNNTIHLPDELCIGNLLKPNTGVFRNISLENILRYPFTVNIRSGKNLIINTASFHNDERNDRIFTALVIRYLESFPAGTAKFGVINYVMNSGLLQILNACSNSVLALDDRVIDNARDKDRILATITKTAQETSSVLSKNFCADLHELYEKNIKGDYFQVLFIKDILRGTNEEGLKTLFNLIETYYGCGVRIVWMDDFSNLNLSNQSAQYKERVKLILDACNVVTLTENGYFHEGAQVELLSLSDGCTNADIYSYCLKYKGYLNSMQKDSITYEDIGFGTDNAPSIDSATISIPVAWNAPNVWDIEFNCQNDDPIANLIVGVPGTGKSHFIDAIILNGAWKYSPDELVFHLIDFKDGLASSAYADDRCKIPHVKVVSTKNKKEEAEIILSGILAEKELRAQKCAKLGVGNIAAYNKKSTVKMPRLIVIIDECQHLFDDEYLSQMSEIIVREGRAMGIHLVLATQTVTPKMMKTIAFVNGRYCYQTKTDTELGELMGKEFKSRLNEVDKSTHLVFAKDWKDNGKVKKIIPAFDGDTGDDYICRSGYARKIRNKWSSCPIDVFDVSDISPIYIENTKFSELFKNTEELSIPVGINYQNRSNVLIRLEPKKQNAVLMIGTNENISNGVILSVIMKSLIDKVRLYYVGKNNAPEIQLGLNISSKKGYANIYACDQYMLALKDVYSIYKERRQHPDERHQPVIVVFDGLQTMEAFISDEKSIPSGSNIGMSITQSDGQHLSFRERRELREQQQAALNSDDGIKVYGKGTFIELLGNAYSVNIYIFAVFDSISITSSNGKLFSYNDNRVLGACNYKLFFPSFDSDEIKQVMDSRFKETILNGLNENLCFMSENVQRGKQNLKVKVYNYSNLKTLENNIVKKFLEESVE